MPLDGFATGLVVESHEGRPTKIEGNKNHPASLGATDVFSQASVLALYDPDRSQTLTYLGEIVTWSAFLGGIRPAVVAHSAAAAPQQSAGAAPGQQPAAASPAQQQPGKSGLRILTGTVTSPSLGHQLKTLLATMPTAKWHQYEPAGCDNSREGSRLAFGQYANTIYHFDKADVVLSLDSDFLSCGPANLRYAHDFATKRRLSEDKRDMNRLYVVESTISNAGAVADHRLPLRPSEVEGFARELAAAIGAQNAQNQSSATGSRANWMAALAKDLREHRGSSIVIVGDSQPPSVHALAHSMNQALGNVGNTVTYIDPVEVNPVDGNASLRELVADMSAGKVDLLLILGGNPVYNAPADLDFGNALRKVQMRVHLSLYKDETSELCQWHIPEAHYLESWSDARAYDGTVSIIQPLISPLYSGKTAHEVLSAVMGEPERSSYEILREYWMKRHAAGGQEPPVTAGAPKPAATGERQPQQSSVQQSQAPPPQFEQFWRKALHDGLIANTASPAKTFSPKSDVATQPSASQSGASSQLEIVFKADPTIHDGRFSNNGWLQELPKPINRLTWDNAAIVSPATAASLGVGKSVNGYATNPMGSVGGEILADRIELQYRDRAVIAPVFIQPGQPDNVVTVHLGYGRTIAGRVGRRTGFNAYAIRTSDAPWFGTGLRVAKVGGTYSLVTTQTHHLIDPEVVGERDVIRSNTLEEFLRGPEHGAEHEEPKISMFPPFQYDGYAWGMSIDLNSCVGCSACVVACVAENNIPVVGKEQVARSREMHWIRVDAYYKGGEKNPETYFQPVPCQQCENAPCELVCPVAATTHSAEGLNDMTYNRCIGTRYCSNNCPYKVRRFNFLLYQDFYTASLKMLRNPDVSVRSRGVMEKCTYCVQRIQRGKIESEKENRRVRDGEITPACAQACPTEAIVFGDINDPGSRVAKLKANERNYSLLGDLNTKPRTTYLSAVRNRNPELESA
jgi:molybdopterin-containing oxidoreductase family iron-sulfur binding subunit